MKCILRNILAVPAGLAVFIAGDIIIPIFLYLIAQIPVLGKAIFFLGTRPDQIVANYSVWIVSMLTLLTTSAIASPDKKGRKPGTAVLFILIIPLYFIQAHNMYTLYGITIDLFLYAISAASFVIFSFCCSFSTKSDG